MKKLFLSVCFTSFFISCSSDSSEPEAVTQPDDEIVVEEEEEDSSEDEMEEISLLGDITVLGKELQGTGNLARELLLYDSSSEIGEPPLDIYSDLGILDLRGERFMANKDGLLVLNSDFNVELGVDFRVPYFKNFTTGETKKIEVDISSAEVVTIEFSKDFLYVLVVDESTRDPNDFLAEYSLWEINISTEEKRELKIDRFRGGTFTDLVLRKFGQTIYIFWTENSTDVNARTSFHVIDLENFEILGANTEMVADNYNLVGDELGNCYIFGALNYRYDISSNILESIEVPGSTTFLKQDLSSAEIQQTIFGENYYFAAIGPQPGPLFSPAIYNLRTGQVSFLNINEEITQFEGDEIAWRASPQSFVVDVENNIFLVGVSGIADASVGNKSFALFAVDFGGNVLEKKQIPIQPIQLLK
ncbi:hypothetical protein MTsPCn5_04540 [Croceitalea sp. MTPC5]|uniref:hypothetical protein n=1 Tax=Croceitalea sp. MTPC5 TaxID=3056565 RepID=UPI002B3F5D28|nr:hypothetical protein MTsPCn5_04540 [Croceitalea sp. MTPC5]